MSLLLWISLSNDDDDDNNNNNNNNNNNDNNKILMLVLVITIIITTSLWVIGAWEFVSFDVSTVLWICKEKEQNFRQQRKTLVAYIELSKDYLHFSNKVS